MNRETVLLNPVLFDALHLSALAHGGIGRDRTHFDGKPWCVTGHAWYVTRDIPEMGECAYSLLMESVPQIHWPSRNDKCLRAAGLDDYQRVPFERWCEIVGVDVALTAAG